MPGAEADGAAVGAGGLAVGPTGVYWTAAGPVVTAGAVLEVALDGGALTTLAPDQDGPNFVALDSVNVYWTNYNDGTVMSMPLDGGRATTLASDQAGPQNVALDSTSVYWANYAGGEIMKVAKP